eukprot:CFRG0639T1
MITHGVVETTVQRLLAERTDPESIEYIVDTISSEPVKNVDKAFLEETILPLVESSNGVDAAIDELITLFNKVTTKDDVEPIDENVGTDGHNERNVSSQPLSNSRKSEARPPNRKKRERKKASAPTVNENKLESTIQVYARVSRFHTEITDNRGGELEVDLKDVTIEFLGKELLSSAELKLVKGRKYCFIGRNGCGKTTLLKQMASGNIPGWPRSMVTLFVEQEYVGSADKSAIEYVVESDRELNALLIEKNLLLKAVKDHDRAQVVLAEHKHHLLDLERIEAIAFADKMSGTRGWQARQAQVELEVKLADAKKELEQIQKAYEHGEKPQESSKTIVTQQYSDVEEKLRAAGAEDAVSRAKKILHGLGLTAEMMNMPSSKLSGGWRMRCALGAALFAEPHLLLLDEPSNHLDLRALLWLEKYIVDNLHEATVVCVSHDRALIDTIAEEMIWLRQGKLTYHPGNYSKFIKEHEQKLLHNTRQQEAIDKDAIKYKEQIHKMERSAAQSGNDKALKQAASRKKKLENRSGVERNAAGHRFKLNRDLAGFHLTARAGVEHEVAETDVRLKLKSAAPLGYYGPVLQMEDLNCGYPGLSFPVVSNVTIDVNTTSRIAIVGENGSGKSTLFSTLMGTLEPVNKAVVLRHPRLQIGYFAQHHTLDLDPTKTAIQHILSKYPKVNEQAIRTHLGSFGITGKLPSNPLRTLSGGQRVRVVLATVFMSPPHILILDEITNHLDIETIQALTKALKEFQGGILFTSHDRQFTTDLADKIYVVNNGRMLPIPSYQDYVKVLEKNN